MLRDELLFHLYLTIIGSITKGPEFSSAAANGLY